MRSQPKSQPTIGVLNSDSSSDEYEAKRSSVSGSDTQASDRKRGGVKAIGSKPPIPNAPNGYVELDKTRIGTLEPNTRIQYKKMNGKVIDSKYFKKIDNIAGTIIVGFYTHNRKNYPEALANIKSVYVSNVQGGASDDIKDAIEIPKSEWKGLRRGMIITYQKLDNEFTNRASFNAFVKGKDGSTRMSMTSERGFSFSASPDNIKKIYRHLTGQDKTMAQILKVVKGLEDRIRALEQRGRS